MQAASGCVNRSQQRLEGGFAEKGLTMSDIKSQQRQQGNGDPVASTSIAGEQSSRRERERESESRF